MTRSHFIARVGLWFVTISESRSYINNIHNIAKSFKWDVKKEGEWNFEAQQRLLAKLL